MSPQLTPLHHAHRPRAPGGPTARLCGPVARLGHPRAVASTDGRLRRREYWHLPGRATRVLLATSDTHLLAEVARTARALGLAVSNAPDLPDLDDEDGGRGVDRLFHRIARELTTAEADDLRVATDPPEDRKSTRLNSSHANISYAVFCLKKKRSPTRRRRRSRAWRCRV